MARQSPRKEAARFASLLVVVTFCVTIRAERSERHHHQLDSPNVALVQETSSGGFTVGLEVEIPNGSPNRMYLSSGVWKQQTPITADTKTCTIPDEKFQPCRQLMDYGYPWLISAETENGYPKMRLESEDYEKNTLEIVTAPTAYPEKSVTRIWRLTKFMKKLTSSPVLPLKALNGIDMTAEFSKQEATGLKDQSGFNMMIPDDAIDLPESGSTKPTDLLDKDGVSCFQRVGIKPQGANFFQAPQVNFVMKLALMPQLAYDGVMVNYFGPDGSTSWQKADECYKYIPAFSGFQSKQKGAVYLSLFMLYMVDKCRSDWGTTVTANCKYKFDLLPKVTLEDFQFGASTKKGLQDWSGYNISALLHAMEQARQDAETLAKKQNARVPPQDKVKCKLDNPSFFSSLSNQKMVEYIFSHAPPGVVDGEAVVMEARNPGHNPAESVKKFIKAINDKGPSLKLDDVCEAMKERKALKCVFDGLKEFAWVNGNGLSLVSKKWDDCWILQM